MSVKSIEAWIAASGAQPPLLVSTDPTADLGSLISQTALRDVEVLALPAENKLTIKQVRALLEKLALTVTVKRRIVFIPDAERLQIAAANTLLKTLEEASAKNRFLLTSAYPGRLIATIRSRCQFLRLPRKLELTDTAAPVFDAKRKNPLTSDEATAIAQLLQSKLHGGDMTPPVQRSMARLRDFYKARALGAGEKLASDALLASLVEIA